MARLYLVHGGSTPPREAAAAAGIVVRTGRFALSTARHGARGAAAGFRRWLGEAYLRTLLSALTWARRERARRGASRRAVPHRRAAEPAAPAPPLDRVDEASWESFPASDSPGY